MTGTHPMTLPGDPFEAAQPSARVFWTKELMLAAPPLTEAAIPWEPTPYLDQTGIRDHQLETNRRLRMEALTAVSKKFVERVERYQNWPGVEGQ